MREIIDKSSIFLEKAVCVKKDFAEGLIATLDKAYTPIEPLLLGDGEVYTTRFDDGEELLGTRNPHITIGNIFLAKNKKCDEIDAYLNLTDDTISGPPPHLRNDGT